MIPETPETYDDPSFSLTSPAFSHEETIPIIYTCAGSQISPPLAWRTAPADTKSFALIVHDTDTPHGDMTHWVLFNIPGTFTELAQGDDTNGTFGIKGKNGEDTLGYLPPCPPPGDQAHWYTFELMAIDRMLDLPEGATRAQVEDAALPHTQSVASFVGMFGRPAA